MRSLFGLGITIFMTMTMIRRMQLVANTEDRARDLAQAKVDRETRRLDGAQAAVEYAAKQAAVSENIARLRQLRLAREAVEGAADVKSATPTQAKKKIRRVTGR